MKGIEKTIYGKIENQEVYLFTLTNINGMQVKLSNYGGIVTSIVVPDKHGMMDDVVLGFDDLDGYLKNEPYFGAIVGRYANRIAKGKFSLEGVEYNLALNNGPNHLHGGIRGFDKVIWEATELDKDQEIGVQLQYLSRDGEEGYPGNLEVVIKYMLTDENELKIIYRAETDKATPINLSHHSYFNLSGSEGHGILEQTLWLNADKFSVVDHTLIPTGELRPVAGGAMDFTNPKPVGAQIDEVEGGYDHNFVLNRHRLQDKVAELYDKLSGRVLEVYTTEPGIQFYSGNFLDGTISGKKGKRYNKHFGLCLETQHFPDSPNHPEFPNTILKPGEEYQQVTVYKFGVE
ncbi:MAG: galactose mutarotase [Bacteroidales bacterium]|nr:galactose mutarotase [Bacteroidales bacterium]